LVQRFCAAAPNGDVFISEPALNQVAVIHDGKTIWRVHYVGSGAPGH
jgi:hypothetical protein